jgi:hypothetical protein
MSKTQARLAEQAQQKKLSLPDKYVLLIKTPREALVIEGRRDFAEHNNRDASTVVWFELLLKLTKTAALREINSKYGLTHYSPFLSVPSEFNGMTIEHTQDGTVAFRGRMFSNCAVSSEDTTLEMFAYFKEVIASPDDEVRTVLQEFCVGLYDV